MDTELVQEDLTSNVTVQEPDTKVLARVNNIFYYLLLALVKRKSLTVANLTVSYD